jgi:hypothetical protein
MERDRKAMGHETEREGMTAPREWPYRAANARDRAAEELQRALRELSPIVTQDVRLDELEMLRRQATALLSIQTALRHLESAGACTLPE